MPESGLQSAPEATPARTADVFRAAAELMVEKGYGGTSIGDIAQAVGMTKAGLYHHISGKQDMLYQILNHALDELDRVVSTPVRSIEDPEARLRQLIRLHIRGSIEHGLAFTALMSEINHLAAKQQKMIRGRIEQYHALIRETLQELDGKTPFSRLVHVEHGIKPFEGALDEVSVWARGLTAAEIAELAK